MGTGLPVPPHSSVEAIGALCSFFTCTSFFTYTSNKLQCPELHASHFVHEGGIWHSIVAEKIETARSSCRVAYGYAFVMIQGVWFREDVRRLLLLTGQDVSQLEKGAYDAAFHAAVEAAEPVESVADLRRAKGTYKVAATHTLLKLLQ